MEDGIRRGWPASSGRLKCPEAGGRVTTSRLYEAAYVEQLARLSTVGMKGRRAAPLSRLDADGVQSKDEGYRPDRQTDRHPIFAQRNNSATVRHKSIYRTKRENLQCGAQPAPKLEHCGLHMKSTPVISTWPRLRRDVGLEEE